MKTFVLLLCLITPVFPQSQDVSNKVKDELRYIPDQDQLSNMKGSSWGIDFIGASLENNGTLHITFSANDMIQYSKSKIMVNKAYGVVQPIFCSAKNLFKRFAKAETVNMYFVLFSQKRDQYGNEAGIDKKIIANFTLSRKRSEKLNWDYIEKCLYDVDRELLHYLDSYWFDKDFFEE